MHTRGTTCVCETVQNMDIVSVMYRFLKSQKSVKQSMVDTAIDILALQSTSGRIRKASQPVFEPGYKHYQGRSREQGIHLYILPA